ncbi:S-layer homology domain-containing protein, partial [Paenibacillus sepulcri]|nr:S-layer homology domain-containing protein [Paenibacillus sepulcri]
DAAGNSSKAAAPFSMTYHSPTPPVTSPTPPVTSPTPTQPAMPSEPGTNDWEFDILVNGRAERVGKAAIQEANDQQVTTITMDEEKLAQLLKEEGERAVIIIPVTTDSDVVIAELNGRLVKDMEAQQNVVEVRTMQAAYTLPAEQINIDAISQRFGTNVGLQDIKVRLEIAKPSPEAIHMVELAAANDGFALAAPPVNFKVSAVHGDRQEEVTKFNAYVEHSVALPEGADPSHITTGIVVEPDGTVRPVPTRIAVIDGKSYAQINSLISGMYSVVWHSLAFKDVENHWAKEAVNDMGSRMVIDGIGNGLFLPDQSISRADFAAIMVRGLGLQLESGSTPFTDMCQKEEGYQQAVITAYSYGLVSGFEDGSFRPLDKITREQAMVIIAKAMKITYLQGVNAAQTSDHVLHSFTDAINVSDWAKSSFAICVQAGIVSGRDNGQLEPKAFITRAETALIMQRLLQKSDLI